MSLSVDGLDQYVQDWHPDPVSDTELLSARPAAALAATLDLDCELDVGDALPAMWHSVYFAEWSPTSALGADGHPGEGRFMPPIPNRRRMFAGGRLVVHEPLVLGREATRRAEVVSTAVKNGKTGQLLFVTVRYEYSQDGQPRLTEEHDLVYRSDTGSSTPFTRVDEALSARSAPWAVEPTTHPALLFRFSALTSNAHRIHYDTEYAREVEGFPALVVHGPLLVLYMAELARINCPRPLQRFRYRLMKPVFLGDAIRVQGDPAVDGDSVELSVVSGAGTIHASAQADYA
ncbi:FAS1-like dehydratase domain-containing protein [Mycolicibacterium diernhoferi]|nr:MaoC family dehydratase N-terminal domain-containing protein [Mycolicibacterium diernhoferi]PEG54686.1 hypothetical protein CRI78_09210 [Mycolicibacterium diernhoferi]QYL22904.1 MaoC family dehydratase N-terminal domain-containing protein [Mycolicibacterium diernhoferi]